MADFLFEIGLEVVPARMIAGAQAELQQRVVTMLERERLVLPSVAINSFATPRRLAILVKDVAARQEDVSEERTWPSWMVGYEAGAETYGHRVLFGDYPIALKEPGEYEDALLSGLVVANVEARRQKIRKALDKATRAGDTEGAGLRWREDHALVDKLTQLTE